MKMNTKHKLWTEKYRPTTLKTYIFHDPSHERSFTSFIKDKTIPNLLFSGVSGSGKTTIAQILVKELAIDPMDYLIINASDENSVDVMREKIKDFASTWAIGNFKIVHLEEADYITPNGQAILRRLMEDYADSCRFILTCNYENKIIPAIKSRVQQFRFKAPDIEQITELVAKILGKEKIKVDLNVLETYVAIGYPDIRKIINLLQQNTHNDKLLPAVDTSQNNDYKYKLLELLNIDNWIEMRKLACANVLLEEWPEVYRFLYENLHKSKKFSIDSKWEEGIITIADHLYKHSLVADPEINAAAMFIRLANI